MTKRGRKDAICAAEAAEQLLTLQTRLACLESQLEGVGYLTGVLTEDCNDPNNRTRWTLLSGVGGGISLAALEAGRIADDLDFLTYAIKGLMKFAPEGATA